MNNIIFQEVVLNKLSTTDEAVLGLIKDALNSSRSFSSFCSNIDYASGNTVVLGAFVSGELVCINVFMRMHFVFDHVPVVGYQSGFSATSSRHRGQGIWPKLMVFAEDFLTALGASFVFGYPNPVSHPLFVKKLGYRSMNLHHLLLTRYPFWQRWAFRIQLHETVSGTPVRLLRPIIGDNIAWKKRESSSHVEVFNFNQSVIWGKIRTTARLGIGINFFEAGGIELNSPADLIGLFKTAFLKTGVFICHVSLNEENEIFSAFNIRRNKYSPVIVKVLGSFDLENAKLNFFGGMRDTY